MPLIKCCILKLFPGWGGSIDQTRPIRTFPVQLPLLFPSSLCAEVILHFPEDMLGTKLVQHFSERASNFTIISDKSDIIEVAASDRIRTIIRFSSEIAGALNIDATVFLFCHLSDDALALLVGVLLQHICDLDQGLLGKPLECRNLEKCNFEVK